MPSSSDSKELDYLKQVSEFTKKMAEFGEQHFDKKLDALPDKIKGMLQELGIGSGKPKADIDKMTPVEQAKYHSDEYNAALARGDSEAADKAFVSMELANQAAIDPHHEKWNQAYVDQQWTRAGALPSMFFSTFGLTDRHKADRLAESNNVEIIQSSILNSSEETKDKASGLLKAFEMVPKDVRKAWNENDTLNNGFASAKTIDDLIAAIRVNTLSNGKLSEEMKVNIVSELQ